MLIFFKTIKEEKMNHSEHMRMSEGFKTAEINLDTATSERSSRNSFDDAFGGKRSSHAQPRVLSPVPISGNIVEATKNETSADQPGAEQPPINRHNLSESNSLTSILADSEGGEEEHDERADEAYRSSSMQNK